MISTSLTVGRRRDATKETESPNVARPGQTLAMRGGGDFRHSLGNRAVGQLLQLHAPSGNGELPTRASRAVAQDISRTSTASAPNLTIQPKLTINKPRDSFELEADRIAAQVMRMPEGHFEGAENNDNRSSARSHDAASRERVQTKLVQGSEEAKDRAALPIVHEALCSSGQPLDGETLEFMEQRFGHDFSQVRVHTDSKSAESARAIHASGYTVGRDIVFGENQYSPQTTDGRHLLAHELTHVAQQSLGTSSTPGGNTVQRDEPRDAGVPIPAGVPEIKAPAKMDDKELGPALLEAQQLGDIARAEAIEAEIDKRMDQWGGTAAPPGPEPVTGAKGAVTPAVALEFLDNMARGERPWKPEKGLGGSAWFTMEGNPYTGVSPEKSINVEVEIAKGNNPLIFKEVDLIKIYEAEAGPAAIQAEAEYRDQYRAKFKTEPPATLSNTARKKINRVLSKGGGRGGLIEKRMWTRVGEIVAKSSSKVGEVVLEPGSRFSDTPGKFGVVADASKISLKGGTGPVVDALTKSGVSAEPVVVEAAEALAKKMKWAGRVRGVFRYGGRVLIVVGVTHDLINIFRAKDKKKAVLTSAGGWAGATAAGAAFAAWFAPADLAGPWAWLGHGVGTLVAGGIGYFIGSETVRYIYELAVEP